MASSSVHGDSKADKRSSTSDDSPPEKEAEEQRNWLELPREVTASILSKLTVTDILTSAQYACKAWLEVSNDPLVWRKLEMHYSRDLGFGTSEKMFRHAVDRSCGQVVEINIEYYANDILLNYITESSTRIKRLRLTGGYVTDEGLIENVAQLPLLEELELTLCSFSAEPLAAVGFYCSHLKSLKLNCEPYRLSHLHPEEESEFNSEAIVIGKNMPELRHLQLIGNPMTNMGLKAILEGCPHLESLDLRRCLNISLTGDLLKSCTDQVKNLQLPNDSTEDCPFMAYGLDDDSENSIDYISSEDNYYPYYGLGIPHLSSAIDYDPLAYDFVPPYVDEDGEYVDFSSADDDIFNYDDFNLPNF